MSSTKALRNKEVAKQMTIFSHQSLIPYFNLKQTLLNIKIIYELYKK